MLILLIGLALFFVALLAGIATVSFLTLGRQAANGLTSTDIAQFINTIFAGIPLFLTGFYFTMGLLWELNASAEAESTDAINWLPISPGEYVWASSLSTSYTYSPVLLASFGFAIPIAVFSANAFAFSLLVPLAFLASMTGSMSVEILRASLSRVSSAFNKVGGRPFIVMRILGIVLILVFTQLLFNGFFISRIIGSITSGSSIGILVPILWPTISITRAMGSDPVLSGVFLLLSVGFLTALTWIALSVKARYWVVAPPAVHFSPRGAVSGPSWFGVHGFNQASLALFRREVRSATRRKEVIRLTVVPIIIPVLIGFPLIFSPTGPSSTDSSSSLLPIFLGAPLLFGVGLGALFLGMTALGQEGKCMWALSTLPVTAAMVVRSKIFFTSIVSTIGLVLAAIVAVLGLKLPVFSLFPFFGIGFCVILAETGIGMAVGSRFADFSEGPRPRFVTITGSIIGSIIGLLGMIVMVAPVGVALFFAFFQGSAPPLSLALTISGLLGLLLAATGYKLSIKPVGAVLKDLPS